MEAMPPNTILPLVESGFARSPSSALPVSSLRKTNRRTRYVATMERIEGRPKEESHRPNGGMLA